MLKFNEHFGLFVKRSFRPGWNYRWQNRCIVPVGTSKENFTGMMLVSGNVMK